MWASTGQSRNHPERMTFGLESILKASNLSVNLHVESIAVWNGSPCAQGQACMSKARQQSLAKPFGIKTSQCPIRSHAVPSHLSACILESTDSLPSLGVLLANPILLSRHCATPPPGALTLHTLSRVTYCPALLSTERSE